MLMHQWMNTQRVAAGGFLLALLTTLAVISCSGAAAFAGGLGPAIIRMQVIHTDADRGLSPHDLLHRMVRRSKTRAARFLSTAGGSSATSAPVTPGQGHPGATEYLVSFAIGTPPQPVKMTLDTGSDLIWTQCQPCVVCYDQALPYFDMATSTTFVPFPCNSSTCQKLPWPSCGGGGGGSSSQALLGNETCGYTYIYGDMSITSGVLAGDTFTFDDGGGSAAAVDGVAFGCGFSNQGLFEFNSSGTGIAAFGRGAMSLPSQLKVDNFSYCFTNITGSTPSSVLLGLPANLYAGGATVQTTPLNTTSPFFYYLNLQSITVGSTTLQVPPSTFALKDDGGITGGTIIDSGTSITLLPPHVYSLLRDAFVSELNMTAVNVFSPPDDVLCFPAPATTTTMPKLQLQLDGATLDLPQENYVFTQENDTCIAIGSSGGDMTIIGNYQQQNMHVLYDLAGNTLSFVPAQCDRSIATTTTTSRAALHARGCAYFLRLFLSVAMVFVLIILY